MDVMVVDPNIAFATLLKQELVRLGHHVAACTSGVEALALARREMPELALLDMALDGPGALALGRQLRDLEPGVRLMLIPMMGDEPVLGDDAPSIQGILPKPFFLPELPNAIQAALDASLYGSGLTQSAVSQPLDESLVGMPTGADPESVAEAELEAMFAAGEAKEAWDPGPLDWLAGLDDADMTLEADLSAELEPAPAARVALASVEDPPPAVHIRSEATSRAAVDAEDDPEPEAGVSRRAFRMNQGRIETLMLELAADTGADGVLLTSEHGLLTSVGNLEEAEIESIGAAVLRGAQTSAEVARILGREQLRFEQSIDGGSYILYALGVHDAVLAVAVSGDPALGLLRLTARSAAERIAVLCVA